MSEDEFESISCADEWWESKGWSLDLPEEEQTRIEMQFVAESCNLREVLWRRHYRSLPQEERVRLDASTHPSCSSKFAEEALIYLREFQERLSGVEFVEDISMSNYMGDTIVFTVILKRKMHWRAYRKSVPDYYLGFQVFVADSQTREET